MTALLLAAAYVVGVVAVARAVRLVIHDDWPPVRWAREQWIARTSRFDAEQEDLVPGQWTALATCPFCFAPYPAAAVLAVAIAGGIWSPDLGTLAGWWWALAVWASGSYAAAMIVLRDEPPPVDE